MALASVAAGADGLMIEVHPTPSEAAVDPLQPLDYSQFGEMVRRVKLVSDATRLTR
jgi:3-deoxy-7-phosphoheptulonate synthase